MPGAGMAAMLTTVIGLLLLCSIAWARLSGRLERVPGPDVAFAAVLVSVVFSRCSLRNTRSGWWGSPPSA